MRRLKFSPGLPALLFALSLPASASDDVLPLLPLSLDALIATPVTTASRRAETREHTPAHILVITREQMRDRRYKNLADLIEDLPGVDFQRGTRSSQYNHFVFQGNVSNNKLLILLDGVRIDHPAGGKIPIAENFSLYFAKQVEVLYGPAAALYGADALGGVINIITEKPSASGGKIALGVGSFGSLEGDFLANGKFGDSITVTAGAHYQKSDRAPLDEYYRKDFPKVDARTFGGAVIVPAAQREDYTGEISSQSQYLRVDAGENLTVGFYRNRFRSLTSTGDRPTATLYLNSAYWDTTIDTWHARYRTELAPGLQSETVIDYSRYEVSPGTRYVNVFTNFDNHGYDYAYGRRSGIEQNLSWQPNENHTLLAGIGYRDFRAIETPDLPHPYDTSRSASNQGMTYPNTNLPLQIFSDRYRSWAGYLQWQAQWTPAFSTVAGIRHDRYSTYGNTTNPRLGLVWQPLPGNFIKLLYGEAFRAPSPEESYSAFGSFNSKGEPKKEDKDEYVRFRAPNTNLQPEKSRTWSLTWDWRPSRNFNVISNLYLTEVEKVIVTAPDSIPRQYIPGVLLGKTSSKQNNGVDRYQGIDVIPQWKMHLGGPWTGDFWGSYSYIDGWFRQTASQAEQTLINIASHKIKLGVTLRYQDWLTITPRLQWIDETSTGAINSDSGNLTKKTPPYTLASLHIGIHKLAKEQVSLYFDIYNLFDRRYYAAHTSSDEAVMQAVPQQPRTFMGTLEYRF